MLAHSIPAPRPAFVALPSPLPLHAVDVPPPTPDVVPLPPSPHPMPPSPDVPPEITEPPSAPGEHQPVGDPVAGDPPTLHSPSWH